MTLSFGSATVLVASLALCSNCGLTRTWPTPNPSGNARASHPADVDAETNANANDSDDRVVRSLPVCVSAEVWSAGELGTSVLYRYRREGRRLHVGYFVYWTTERPWGANALSYAVLPALFIDAVYSHLLFVFPGAQQVMYGPGDVEGARVVYEQGADGRWLPIAGAADDGLHREVALSPDEMIDRDSAAVVLRSDVWSHQLGAHRSKRTSDATGHIDCFVGAALSPLTAELADTFRLGSPESPRRAAPAWQLDAPDESVLTAPIVRAQAADDPTPNRVAVVGP